MIAIFQLILKYGFSIFLVALFNAELTLAQARGNEYQNLEQIYEELGGGWKQ